MMFIEFVRREVKAAEAALQHNEDTIINPQHINDIFDAFNAGLNGGTLKDIKAMKPLFEKYEDEVAEYETYLRLKKKYE